MTLRNARAWAGDQLAPDEIHLWEIALDAPHAPSDLLRESLSDTELEQASRFYFLKHKHRWTTARAAFTPDSSVIRERATQIPEV
ncbi:MAG: hypothetical protein ACREYC_20550 [Gammaproteobacteria bacterium]